MSAIEGSLNTGLIDAAVDLLGRSGRGGTVRVRGRSMLPTLVEGQLLEVEFEREGLGRGDMLLFRQEGHLIVHRLLGSARLPDGRPCLRTGGDGFLALDAPVMAERLVGRVVAVQDGREWRSVRGRRARVYAWCLAWHKLAWAAAGILASRTDRILTAWRLRSPLRHRVTRLEHGILRWVHRLLFRRLHATVPGPEAASGDAPGVP